jgi:glycine oxidase
MQQADVAIAGAGIIGLSAALELASAGLQVVVFERGEAMGECSWAAAGMLAAGDPENPLALRPLSALSLSLYPEFLADIERLSGKNVPIRTTQTLQLAHALPFGTKKLTAEAIESIAPGLQTNGLEFFLLEEKSLDPRDLVHALPEAMESAGITLIEQTTVSSIALQSDSVLVRTTRGEWRAKHFINACGAWASGLTGIPISPRKGQLLVVECPEQITVVLRTPDVYLVPRGDGRIVIGATVEDAGYDKHIDAAAVAALHKAAAELWPPIRGARILDSWTGLRPATADLLPVIGPAIEIDDKTGARGSDQAAHSWLALGHFRNGILLAPGTARLLRHLILKDGCGFDAGPYSASRFVPSFAR